jgi:hypothetical protein
MGAASWRLPVATDDPNLQAIERFVRAAEFDSVKVDTIDELTADAGVTIEGVSLKDSYIELANTKLIRWLNNAGTSTFGVTLWSSDILYVGIRATGTGSLSSIYFRTGANVDRVILSTSALYPATSGGVDLGLSGNLWNNLFTRKHTIDLSANSGSGGRDALIGICSSDQNQISIIGQRDGGSNFSFFQLWNADTATMAALACDEIDVGGATGGLLGAGKINVKTGVYLNSTAYTNPDYVFELEYDGKIVSEYDRQAGPYRGRLSLKVLEGFLRANKHLPGVVRDKPVDIFSRADMALEKVEEAHLYIIDLHKRVRALERAA